MTYLWVAAIMLVGVFTQSVSGFGVALVAMPLLSPMLGLKQAAPLMAMVSGTLQIVLLVHFRRLIRISAVWRLCAASALAIPVGIYGLERLDESITLGVLGAVILTYALYALAAPRLPKMEHPAWAYGAGLLAGLLGGAYNTNGPPVVIYGTCRNWTPDQFKCNLQGFFLFSTTLILVGRALCGHVTGPVFQHYLAALPAVAAGTALGLYLARFINPERFKKLILGLLVVLGLRLLYKATMGV